MNKSREEASRNGEDELTEDFQCEVDDTEEAKCFPILQLESYLEKQER